MSLGCGKWRAVLACRGGAELVDLPFAGLQMNRRLDDSSEARVVVNRDSMNKATPALRKLCRGVLGTVNPWEHELVLYRDGQLAWAGPVMKPRWEADKLTINARDLFQWFEVRFLQKDRDYEGVDLAEIFHRHAVDALNRDPSPAIHIEVSATGILGDRSVLFDAYQRAADEMRELARSGLDFTFLGRRMMVGGTEVPVPALGRLSNADFDTPALERDGLMTESESIVTGARGSDVFGPVAGTAGGIDTVMGLVQRVWPEDGIEDEESATAAAESRQEFLRTTPEFFTATLVPTSAVRFSRIVPGALADLRVELFMHDVVGLYRLQAMEATATPTDEKIGVTLTTVGHTEGGGIAVNAWILGESELGIDTQLS